MLCYETGGPCSFVSSVSFGVGIRRILLHLVKPFSVETMKERSLEYFAKTCPNFQKFFFIKTSSLSFKGDTYLAACWML